LSRNRNRRLTGIMLITVGLLGLVVSSISFFVYGYSIWPTMIGPAMGWDYMWSSMMGSKMGRGMMPMPMMEGMMGHYSQANTTLSHDDVRAIARKYLASLNSQDLEIGEIEEYSHNFYVSIIEKSTGRGAIEIIIDRYSGALQPEPQSMMWNTKYGMMSHSQMTEMTITPKKALEIAQKFLNGAYLGTKADETVAYYGYYTIMTTLDRQHYGMLSINGVSGEIWYHTWHGMFITELED